VEPVPVSHLMWGERFRLQTGARALFPRPRLAKSWCDTMTDSYHRIRAFPPIALDSLMWVFIIFFLVHVYMAVLDDVEERDGILSSIVNGVKWPVCDPCVEDEIARRQVENG